MKKITLFLMVFVFIHIARTQTTLQPGEVAIVQVNYTYNSFDFVCFVDIEMGTEIMFTDYAYKNLLADFDETTTYDGIYKFTASQAIPAGTVIQYRNQSNVNPQFTTLAGSSSLDLKSYKGVYLSGENLIVYQRNGVAKNYLFALGWMLKNNFSSGSSNINSKFCDIPNGLSKSNNTVVQIDSVMKAGQTAQLARNFRYNKYDGFDGAASQIRYWLSNTSNYDTFSGSYNNDVVSNFTIKASDSLAPSLSYSYPSNNKANCSVFRSGVLNFNEQVFVKKSLVLADNTTGAIVKTFTLDEVKVQNDSIVLFELYPVLEKATTYKLIFPSGFVTDLDNNSWPATEQVFTFATRANLSVVDLNFGEDLRNSEEVVRYLTRNNIHWTTTERFEEDNQHFCKGYFSWDMHGIPMRWYSNRVFVPSITDVPQMGSTISKVATKLWLTPSDRLVVNLSGVSNTVTDVYSDVHENNCYLVKKIYSGVQPIKTFNVSGTNGAEKSRVSYENTGAVKLDSLVFTSLEGNVSRVVLEIVDNHAPVIELGNTRVICEGDSVQLDAGLTLGALYDWNTGAKTQKIWVKTSGAYSVTVKNSLGQVTDNVQVIVKPVIVLSMPDTIYACVGDTVTLTAGANADNSYFWSPTGQTTPSIKVTKSGIYHVLVNNGFGGCFNTDSTRVIFNGAKLHAFHYQGGSYGSGDVVAQLYQKAADGKLKLYREEPMLQSVQFDSLPKGDYILKSHFVAYSFVGENPWMDTYHDGKTEWKNVTPFKLTCETDTMIGFLIANKPVFVFNGTAEIKGKIQIEGSINKSSVQRVKAAEVVDCDTRIVLYNASADIIATTCPDAQGNYSFSNLPAGNYSVGVERTGFTVQSLYTTNLVDGATVTDADFTVDIQTQSVKKGLVSGIRPQICNGLQFSLSPNPAVDRVLIRFEASIESDALISIYDLTGRKVKELNTQLISGVNSIPMSVQGLSGVYFVQLSTAVGGKVVRLIIN